MGVHNPFKPSASNSEINKGRNLQAAQLFAACSIDWELLQRHCMTSGAGKGMASIGAKFIMIDFFFQSLSDKPENISLNSLISCSIVYSLF